MGQEAFGLHQLEHGLLSHGLQTMISQCPSEQEVALLLVELHGADGVPRGWPLRGLGSGALLRAECNQFDCC